MPLHEKTIEPKGSTAFFILPTCMTIMVGDDPALSGGDLLFADSGIHPKAFIRSTGDCLSRPKKSGSRRDTSDHSSGPGPLLIEQLREVAANYASTTDHQAVLTGLGNLLESILTSGIRIRSGFPEFAYLGVISRPAGAIVCLVVSPGFSTLSLLLNLIISITIVAPLLINYDRAMDWLQRFSPFPNEVDLLFVKKIRSMVRAMFLSIFVIALAQSLVMGLFF